MPPRKIYLGYLCITLSTRSISEFIDFLSWLERHCKTWWDVDPIIPCLIKVFNDIIIFVWFSMQQWACKPSLPTTIGIFNAVGDRVVGQSTRDMCHIEVRWVAFIVQHEWCVCGRVTKYSACMWSFE